ncbi:MAG: cation:proton antiporter [Salinimicrobium sediminis]|uniref:Multisubunit sodium/proton antiporter, MrpF subunit n=1 Tax=Salinimicrobium sediminis TaxID=1343891 RepID=A0A285X3Y2_9FLAO|nr:cation:proton antiporter [Salinimicrobium sediminis]MDX1603086.1 cation:proton antiporter [Salinimicrobium sediminis]MDX1753745.1 cation:proton antiporter [Salinimicrobium sediminis]SOC79089.1 multisubunit sodium/proton antiporter, MrpF subunit [Salinimicrobium sediminis]
MTLDNYLYYIILPVLSLSILLVFLRFFRGPSISDRVIAVDLLVTIGIGIIAIYSILTHQPTFLDIALILALIGFLATVAYSYYIQKRKNR